MMYLRLLELFMSFLDGDESSLEKVLEKDLFILASVAVRDFYNVIHKTQVKFTL